MQNMCVINNVGFNTFCVCAFVCFVTYFSVLKMYLKFLL